MIARIVFVFLTFQYAALALPPPRQVSAGLTSSLNKLVSNYAPGDLTMIEALIHVSNDFQIPMGIAWVDSKSACAKTRFAWKNLRVQKIIESILSTQPGYKILIKNGVVQISPPKDLIPDDENFLRLTLDSFRAQGDFIEIASFKLHMLVTPRKYGQLSIGATGDSKVDVELKNCMVEDVLDALAMASNRKIWIVTFSEGDGVTPRGMFRTTSLWSPKPPPDPEQPGWDLLRWGDKMPPLMVCARN